jgi:hypothetical protein
MYTKLQLYCHLLQGSHGKMAIEVMFFDPDGKVSKVIAHYN